MPGKSDYLETAVINSVLRGQAFPSVSGNVFVSLWKGDPTDTGGSGVEVTGGSYARVAVSRATGSWDAPVNSGGAMTTANTGAVTFPAPTADWAGVGTPADYFGIHDAASGGNLLLSAALTTPRVILNGDSAPSFAPGTLIWTEA